MPAPAVYAVVLPLVPLQVGEWIDRAAWPLHVTLVPNVATDAGYDAVLAVVREAAATLPPLSGVVGEEAWFGPGHDVRVDLIESDALPRAHEALLGALEQRTGARPELPAHQRAGYRAHATVTASGRPQRGARLVFERIAVAEVGPDGRGDLAVPLAVFDLGTTAAPGPATLDAGAALRLYGALAAAGVRCTVVGGWGVDALLGAATRDHHDLDVLVDVTELPALLAALPGLG
ncbi:MAG: nucleotidyltransferase domain-containing protein, partial [Amnibacterium sp.]